MERSIYYNQFDGFTARGKDKLEETYDYFSKLGIKDFVNLITCSDNYDPNNYPSTKTESAAPFIPTWMYAEPSFNGLRLALSESTRLIYSNTKPIHWEEYIQSAKLKTDNVDIDVKFTSGLNVIIGGSSSGKTMLVDSIVKRIKGGDDLSIFNKSNYIKYEVSKINVNNPTGRHPHYIEQNYIMQIVNSQDTNKLTSIDILNDLFPKDDEFNKKVENGIITLERDVRQLIRYVKEIEDIENRLNNCSQIGKLLVKGPIQNNITNGLKPEESTRKDLKYTKSDYDENINQLNNIKVFLQKNPLINDCDNEINVVIKSLSKAYQYSQIEEKIFNVIKNYHDEYDNKLKEKNVESQSKTQEFNKILDLLKKYVSLTRLFNSILKKIAAYNITEMSKKIVSMEHTLDISNHFQLTKDKIIEAFNELLKKEFRIDNFNDITPQTLYKSHFSQKPKVKGYQQFVDKITEHFKSVNVQCYQIKTNDNKDFNTLSAGWKTSVLLDLILGYEADTAPIVIDQPEDNLATSYINKGLVEAIKKIKNKKQIILVSHNATIPMMADAQNIIFCKNKNNKIIIRSSALEGEINGEPVLDLVARITDGGKASIKKRVKKYNLKKFRQ